MEPSHSEDPSAQSGSDAAPQDQAALLRRVEYLEWLTREMAADLTAMREQAPSLFRAAPKPVSSTPVAAAPSLELDRPLTTPASGVPLQKHTPPARKGSFEEEFGSRVLSKVAVVLLLLGVAWFLKWAFENRWIGPSGRIIAGLAAGIGVVVWSERFRSKGMAAFSYALKAVGSGVLYLSLWAAFQLYHLIPPTPALAAMIAVTAWNGFMAWSQDAELLAGYALLGAYLTPVLLSTGGDHEVFLFNYLFIIAAGVVALLRGKPWSRLLLGSLPVTAIFYVAWSSDHFNAAKAPLTLGYALALWAIFAAVPFVAQETGPIVSILVPQGTAAFGAATVYFILADSGRKSQEPWWALGFSAVYLLFTRLRSRGVSSAIHLALGVVFLTIAIPLKATGHGITVGWLTESIALLWVASLQDVEPSARKVLRWLAYGSLALGTAGALFGPWIFTETGHPFTNRSFATSLGAIAALAIAMFLEKRGHPEGQATRSESSFSAIALVGIHLLLLVAMYREIDAYVFGDVAASAIEGATERAGFMYSGWMMLQGAVSLAVGFAKRNTLSRWIGLILLAVTTVKAFVYDMRNLGSGYRVVSFLGLGVVLMAVSFAYQKDLLGLRDPVAQHPDAEAPADEAAQ